ncbi:MAG: sulfatase-like hydrolase/transferase, partial [Phycisphaeraceae bacterium]
ISHSPDGRNLTQNSGGGEGEGSPEIPGAWDTLSTPVGEWGTAWNAFFAYAGGQTRTPGESPPLEAAEVGDRGYPDGVMAEAAVAKLKTLRDGEKPFFFAVGFYKPHLPFNAPQKYWDLYDRDAIDLSDVDPVRRRGGEFFGNYGHSADRVDADPDYARKLRHGYWASTSYADAQVGKVLDALDELGLRENTIVVLWGDHGYHLGELGFWGKHTLHEHSMRSPFIVRTPNMTTRGVPTDALTSSVDIYPTLVELAKLPRPKHLDGRSFAEVLIDPDASVNDHALGFWTGGYTIRTDNHRLIRRGDSVQLFDHRDDFGETTDVAAEQPERVESLLQQLEEHLARRKALPTE